MSHTKCRHHRHDLGHKVPVFSWPLWMLAYSASFPKIIRIILTLSHSQKTLNMTSVVWKHHCMELHLSPPCFCPYVFGKTCIRMVIEKTPSANSTQARLPLVSCTVSLPWRCTKHGSFKAVHASRIKLEWCCHDSIHTCIYLRFAHLSHLGFPSIMPAHHLDMCKAFNHPGGKASCFPQLLQITATGDTTWKAAWQISEFPWPCNFKWKLMKW